ATGGVDSLLETALEWGPAEHQAAARSRRDRGVGGTGAAEAGQWKERRHRVGVWIAYLMLLGPAFLWSMCCFSGGDHALFFSFRTVELRIGTSPAWPILAALAILLVFAVAQLWRMYLAAYETPEILVQFESILQPRLESSYDKLSRILHAPIHWDPTRHLIGAALLALLFFSTDIRSQLRSVDGGWYDALSIVLTMAAVAALLLTGSQANALWRSLQGLLACVHPMPLSKRFVRTEHNGRSRP